MKYASAVCILYSCLLLVSCHGPASNQTISKPSDSTYSITGNLRGLDSGWIFLYHRQMAENNLDSIIVRHGSFSFTGKAPAPEYCLLGISNLGNKEFRLGFFLENGQISISGNKDSLSNALVTGSASQDEYERFNKRQKGFDSISQALAKSYVTANKKKDLKETSRLEAAFNDLDLQRQDFVGHYTKLHPSSVVGAFEIYQRFSFDPEADRLDSIYSVLAASVQQSYYGKKIKTVLDIARKTAVGKMAPEFAGQDANGKSVSLSSFKGKYVLIDFWASWCGPCRDENPSVLKAYRKYHPKGLDIVGISLDEKKDAWIEAVKKDKLEWTQLSDLKGWDNSVAKLYGILGIPMNFLLDREGRIVAKALRGDQLEKSFSKLITP